MPRAAINHKAGQAHTALQNNSINIPPNPHHLPLAPKVSSPNCKSFLAWRCLCGEERTQFGPSSHGNKGASPINQQMLGSSFRPESIDLRKATSQDEFASFYSPCSPLVQPALDMLLDFRLTVSATTIKLGMKASEGCQGSRMAGREGLGTVCEPGRRMDCTEIGSLSQTPLGRHIASNREKKKGKKTLVSMLLN